MVQESGDPCKDMNYAEPDVDSVRALRDQVSGCCAGQCITDTLYGL